MHFARPVGSTIFETPFGRIGERSDPKTAPCCHGRYRCGIIYPRRLTVGKSQTLGNEQRADVLCLRTRASSCRAVTSRRNDRASHFPGADERSEAFERLLTTAPRRPCRGGTNLSQPRRFNSVQAHGIAVDKESVTVIRTRLAVERHTRLVFVLRGRGADRGRFRDRRRCRSGPQSAVRSFFEVGGRLVRSVACDGRGNLRSGLLNACLDQRRLRALRQGNGRKRAGRVVTGFNLLRGYVRGERRHQGCGHEECLADHGVVPVIQGLGTIFTPSRPVGKLAPSGSAGRAAPESHVTELIRFHRGRDKESPGGPTRTVARDPPAEFGFSNPRSRCRIFDLGKIRDSESRNSES